MANDSATATGYLTLGQIADEVRRRLPGITDHQVKYAISSYGIDTVHTPNCERLAAETISALSALGLNADFEHVTDIDGIAAVMPVALPALAVNGRVVAAGRVPSREKIMELIKEATE